jgi:hypothetical protein
MAGKREDGHNAQKARLHEILRAARKFPFHILRQAKPAAVGAWIPPAQRASSPRVKSPRTDFRRARAITPLGRRGFRVTRFRTSRLLEISESTTSNHDI